MAAPSVCASVSPGASRSGRPDSALYCSACKSPPWTLSFASKPVSEGRWQMVPQPLFLDCVCTFRLDSRARRPLFCTMEQVAFYKKGNRREMEGGGDGGPMAMGWSTAATALCHVGTAFP